MEKIWERDDFWDKITGTATLARYANPFRIIDSDGNTLMSKSNIHHLKAKFDEYIFDNKDSIKYPYIVVDTACKNFMVIDEETGYKEWRRFWTAATKTTTIDRGVQNPDQGGANAPPSLFAETLSRAASEEYSLNDRQGGARGFIVNRV